MIQSQLLNLANQNNCKILYACESGSRAWGFESLNSDYDIRFIYVKSFDHYFQLNQPSTDTISLIEGDYDYHGWDLKKALKLLKNNNPSLLEWLQSPIIYFGDCKNIKDLVEFSPRESIFHYSSIAQINYRKYVKNNKVILKKYFYVIRSLLCCEYIKINGTMPPTRFDEVLHLLPSNHLTLVLNLLEKKRESTEDITINVPEHLDYWIRFKLTESYEYAKSLPKLEYSSYEKLNTYFKETVNG